MHQPRRAVDNHTRGERMAGEVVRGQAGLDHLKCRCPLIVGQQHRIIESGGVVAVQCTHTLLLIYTYLLYICIFVPLSLSSAQCYVVHLLYLLVVDIYVIDVTLFYCNFQILITSLNSSNCCSHQ